ncbi:MAG: hypothetical protein N3A38_11000, partial [Planctomycetota bacterium]|nr:hypothetical protein [Planctomycetota bacterium]
ARRGEGSPVAPLADSVEALRIAEAIVESAKKGAAIRLGSENKTGEREIRAGGRPGGNGAGRRRAGAGRPGGSDRTAGVG